MHINVYFNVALTVSPFKMKVWTWEILLSHLAFLLIDYLPLIGIN